MCIGISQVIVISELYYAMQLLQAELMTMDRESLVQHHQTKNAKVRRVQWFAIAAIAATVVELAVRAIFKDYGIGRCVFVLELFLVGSFMLYFTRQFSQCVDEVQKTLCINFSQEKSALQCSLGVFLFTYFLRAVIKGLSIALAQVYGTLWTYPLYAEAAVCLVQQVYDFLPLMIISHQHHTAFKGEARETTSALLDPATNSRDYTHIRPYTDQTMVSLDPVALRKTSYSDVQSIQSPSLKPFVDPEANRTTDSVGHTATNTQPTAEFVRSSEGKDQNSSRISINLEDSRDDKGDGRDATISRDNTMLDRALLATQHPQKPTGTIHRETIAVAVTRQSVMDLMQLKGFRTTRISTI